MRIVSLFPAATEIVAALGAVDELVAISHECDWPPEVVDLPRVTASPIDAAEKSGAIERAVTGALTRGEPLMGVDGPTLRRADPDVILAQSLCAVCAVDADVVRPLLAGLDRPARLVSLGAHDLPGVYDDIRAVGRALDRSTEAVELIEWMRARLDALRASPARLAPSRPRVVCVEWLDPLFLAGHWVPELVEAAGAIDVGARPGDRSRRVAWSHVEALDPDVVLVMPCGFGLERTHRELAELADPAAHRVLGLRPTAVIDGNAYTSRSGPRLAEAAEVIRSALEGALAAPGSAPDATIGSPSLSNPVS